MISLCATLHEAVAKNTGKASILNEKSAGLRVGTLWAMKRREMCYFTVWQISGKNNSTLVFLLASAGR